MMMVMMMVVVMQLPHTCHSRLLMRRSDEDPLRVSEAETYSTDGEVDSETPPTVDATTTKSVIILF